MNFNEIAKMRQSTRAYDASRPVEKEKIEACLATARLAPSACNSQPWMMTVCTGETARKLAPLTQGMGINGWTEEVPVFIVISEGRYNLSEAVGALLKQNDYKSIDIGILSAYLTAEAAAQGLASCILGWFKERAVRKLAGCKGKVRLIIALGYPKTEPVPRERRKARKPLSEITAWKES